MDYDKDTHKIFIFGICILFGWMIVIIICANPMVSYFTLLTLLLLHRKFARGSVEIQMSTTWTFKKQAKSRTPHSIGVSKLERKFVKPLHFLILFLFYHCFIIYDAIFPWIQFIRYLFHYLLFYLTESTFKSNFLINHLWFNEPKNQRIRSK